MIRIREVRVIDDEGQQLVHSYAELYGTQQLPAATFPLRQLCYISRERNGRELGIVATDTLREGAPAGVTTGVRHRRA